MSELRRCPYAYQECKLELGCALFPNGTFGMGKNPSVEQRNAVISERALACIHRGESLPASVYVTVRRRPFPTPAAN